MSARKLIDNTLTLALAIFSFNKLLLVCKKFLCISRTSNFYLLYLLHHSVNFTYSFNLLVNNTDQATKEANKAFVLFPAGPRSKTTHWKQTVLYLDEVLTICEDEVIYGSMTVEPNKTNPRDLEITIDYTLTGKRCQVSRTQHYKMR